MFRSAALALSFLLGCKIPVNVHFSAALCILTSIDLLILARPHQVLFQNQFVGFTAAAIVWVALNKAPLLLRILNQMRKTDVQTPIQRPPSNGFVSPASLISEAVEETESEPFNMIFGQSIDIGSPADAFSPFSLSTIGYDDSDSLSSQEDLEFPSYLSDSDSSPDFRGFSSSVYGVGLGGASVKGESSSSRLEDSSSDRSPPSSPARFSVPSSAVKAEILDLIDSYSPTVDQLGEHFAGQPYKLRLAAQAIHESCVCDSSGRLLRAEVKRCSQAR